MKLTEEFAELLNSQVKKAKSAHNLGATELAKRIGVSESHLRNLKNKNSDKRLNVEHIARFCDEMGFSPMDFFPKRYRAPLLPIDTELLSEAITEVIRTRAESMTDEDVGDVTTIVYEEKLRTKGFHITSTDQLISLVLQKNRENKEK